MDAAAPTHDRSAALDGYRGFAILIVMLNHVYLSSGLPRWMSSVDFLLRGGAVAFMVLSGYLVTLSLLKEEARTGSIDPWDFLRGQLVRLYVPMVAYLTVVCLWFWNEPGFVLWKSVRVLWADPNTARGMNWSGHLYTLAAQLQFFVWWPLLLGRIPERRRVALVGALVLAATMWRTAGMARAVLSGGNDLRTDFVYAPLLVGAWAACFASAGGIDWIFRLSPRRSGLLGLGALLGVGVTRSPSTMLGFASEALRSRALAWRNLAFVGLSLRGLVGLGALLAFAGLVFLLHRGSPAWLSSLFSFPPLAGLGRIAFSVYLWQSVFCLGITGTPADRFPLSVVVAITTGLLAYRWVEVPSLEWRSRLKKAGARPDSSRRAT